MGETKSGAAGQLMRSEERIPRLRARGRANRRKLLATAERMLSESRVDSLRFSDIFEAAGVSRGSAYRIYIGLDDLMHDLAAEWINNFVDHLATAEIEAPPEDWTAVSDFIVRTGALYWKDTEETLRILPRVRTNLPESHKRAQRAMTHIVTEIFNRYFVLPALPDLPAIIGFYVQMGDLTFADAVRREGRISQQRIEELQAIYRTYLSFHFPAWLPRRNDSKRSQS